MPIFGVGADLVDSQRVERLISRDEDIFRARVLGECERLEILPTVAKRRRVLAYARSIAAKEAFLKALGTGLTAPMRWPEIEIFERDSPKPRLKVSGAVAHALAAVEADAIHLALSSVAGLVLAIVTLTRAEAQEISI